MHESESACFLVWALPAVQNKFLNQFSHKVLYNYCSNFFGGFQLVIPKVKKWISHGILKMLFQNGLRFLRRLTMGVLEFLVHIL